MLQVARLSPKILGDSRDLVAGFIQKCINPDGGFQDRGGESDLYYTVFGIDALIALNAPLPFDHIAGYLRRFGNGESLDFVHLASLARCWAGLRACGAKHELDRDAILKRIEEHRTADGGFSQSAGGSMASAYANFLAYGLYQDLDTPIPHEDRLLDSFERMRAEDGAYSNIGGLPFGTTTTTAAVVAILHNGNRTIDPQLGEWLLQRFHPEGGFYAMPDAPLPDLLSTATALNALERLKIPMTSIQEPCLDFVDTLWCSEGGFYGHWADDILDCEYTFYGLLSLGHLSL